MQHQNGILSNRFDDNNLLPHRVRLGNANRFVYPEVRVSKLNARYKDSFYYRFLTMERGVALIGSYTPFFLLYSLVPRVSRFFLRMLTLNVHRSLYGFRFLLNDILSSLTATLFNSVRLSYRAVLRKSILDVWNIQERRTTIIQSTHSECCLFLGTNAYLEIKIIL